MLEEGSGRLRERTEFGIARLRYRTARNKGTTPDIADAERQLGPVIRRAAFGYSPRRLDVETIYFAASESGTDLTVDPWSELQSSSSAFRVVGLEGVHFQPEERCIIGPNRVHELVVHLPLSP